MLLAEFGLEPMNIILVHVSFMKLVGCCYKTLHCNYPAHFHYQVASLGGSQHVKKIIQHICTCMYQSGFTVGLQGAYLL